MSESAGGWMGPVRRDPSSPRAAALGGDGIAGWPGILADLAVVPTDAGRIDQIRLLEDVKAGCAAAQARITASFAASQRSANPPGSEPPAAPVSRGSAAQRGAERRERARRLANRSAAAQVALARRESPTRGGRFVGLADALVHEMPGVLHALQSGVINEWRATVIVRETACLSSEQRSAVDAEIDGVLDGLGDARVEAMVRSIAYRMDPESAVRRASRAAGDRRVSLRPRPDVMASLSSLLPIGAAVACFAALGRAADAHPGGDGRTRDQRMADEFVARLTGSAAAGRDGAAAFGPAVRADTHGPASTAEPTDAHRPASTAGAPEPADAVAAVRAVFQRRASRGVPTPTPTPTPTDRGAGGRSTSPHVPDPAPGARPDAADLPPGTGIEIGLVVTDRTLFGGGDEPALLPGNIPIPAPLARRMVADLPEAARVWIRRLYARPDSGELLAMDARRRVFPPILRRLLFARDGDTCRTPWCNAPARHADHLTPFAAGGPTSVANGQSLSEDCNYARQAPGWSAARDPGGSGDIVVTTPTGHRYRSPCPDVIPGRARYRIDVRHDVERTLEFLLDRVG